MTIVLILYIVDYIWYIIKYFKMNILRDTSRLPQHHKLFHKNIIKYC